MPFSFGQIVPDEGGSTTYHNYLTVLTQDYVATDLDTRRCCDALRANRIFIERHRVVGPEKKEPVDSIAYFWMIADPWIHGTSIPIFSYVGDYICPIAAVFTGGDCGVAESVVSVSEIGSTAKN